MHTIQYVQNLPIDLETAWEFFCNPRNLKVLTPLHMGFEIQNEVQERMYEGQIIQYTIRPFWNLPINWVTEITHVEPLSYFIDEQRIGPYAFWHHEHRFIAIPNGVKMIDTVYYQLPLGPLGKLLHKLKVKSDLAEIFSYREKRLNEIFGHQK